MPLEQDSGYKNVPYQEYQGGRYTSVFSTSSSLATPLMEVARYKEIESAFRKLPAGTQAILTDVAKAEKAVLSRSKFAQEKNRNPVPNLNATRREAIAGELQKSGLGWVDAQNNTFGLGDDARSVVLDIANGKPGFKEPVFNVNGQPVVGSHFDVAGNLSRHVAGVLNVPAERQAAIAARPAGIRKDLLPQKQAVSKPSPRQM